MYSDEMNSTNGAVLAGFTKEIIAESANGGKENSTFPCPIKKTLNILVKSNTDYTTKFKAFDLNAMEYIWLNGSDWNFHVRVIEV